MATEQKRAPKAPTSSSKTRVAGQVRGVETGKEDAVAPRKRPDDWVVLIYMAVTSPELREIMERDLAEMQTQLRLLGPDDLRVYALMDTPDGEYAVRHRIHNTNASIDDPDHAVMRCEPRDAFEHGRKSAFLSKLIRWRFGNFADGDDKDTRVETFGKTLLILWGHSQGVASALSMPGSPAYSMVGNGGFGFSEFSGDSLSLPQIRRAIARGLPTDERINILSFDSCFMSAAEVSAEFQPKAPSFEREDADRPRDLETLPTEEAAQLAAQRVTEEAAEKVAQKVAQQAGDDPARVDFVLASQSAVLLDGLDYGRLIDVFVSNKGRVVTPEKLGRRLLEQASSTSNSPVSLSLLYTGPPLGGEPSPYERFSTALRGLVRELSLVLDTGTEPPTSTTPPERRRLTRPEKNRLLRRRDPERRGRILSTNTDPTGANRSEWLRVRAAFESATWHRVRQFIDVGDLCRRLANNCRTTELRNAALAVLRSLQLPAYDEEGGHADASLVVDVRSLSPLLLSGVSLYCPWLFPTPDEVRNGAWNAVVDLYDYATDLWFNRGYDSWGAFVYNAKHVLEESRQRAINTELRDVRASSARERDAYAAPPVAAQFRDKGGQDKFEGFRAKGGQDKFVVAESTPVVTVTSTGTRAPSFALEHSFTRFADAAAAQGPVDQVPICPRRR
jgi:cysteine peptidase C11 family protein